MSLDTIAVWTIVTLALLFVVRRAWQSLRASKQAKGGGCDGCG